MKSKIIIGLLTLAVLVSAQNKLLVSMDISQSDHLKSYGLSWWVLKNGEKIEWLLNYKGG